MNIFKKFCVFILMSIFITSFIILIIPKIKEDSKKLGNIFETELNKIGKNDEKTTPKDMFGN